MKIIQIISLIALAFCLLMLLAHFIRLVKLGKPKDLSQKSGDVSKGILYSNTVAMMPANKESAYMHLPTYSAGILFHTGIFLSFLLYLLSLFNLNQYYPQWLNLLLGLYLLVGSICGISLLIKRLVNKNLHSLANPDDYISNILATLFQLFTALYLIFQNSCSILFSLYYVVAIILFIYMPLGKLKHLLYYFAARYHLGFFYGWRNVWPPHKEQ